MLPPALVVAAALAFSPAISQENDRHAGTWSVSLAALYGFGQHVSGPGAALDAFVYRGKGWGIDLQAGGVAMTGAALTEVRGWAAALIRGWLPIGWVRLELALGPAGIVQQTAAAGSRSFGAAAGLAADAGVSLAATAHVDLFARATGQLATGTFWLAGAMFGVQARFE